MRKFVDLSHHIQDGMVTYPGLPRPRIGAVFDHEQSRSHYDGKAEFCVNLIHMASSTGTYMDAPFHRHRAAPDLAAIPLDSIAGLPGIVFVLPIARSAGQSGSAGRAVDITIPAEDLRGKAVLVATGWDTHWGTDAYWAGPHLSERTVDLLVEEKAALVGVDFANVDDTNDLSRPAHTRLLAGGTLIVENLTNLLALQGTGFRFFAVPPLIERGASFPVRAFAEITEVRQ